MTCSECPGAMMGLGTIKLKGLNQTDLEHIIDQGNLSKILSGKRKIGAKLAKRFGEYFGVNPGVFL